MHARPGPPGSRSLPPALRGMLSAGRGAHRAPAGRARSRSPPRPPGVCSTRGSNHRSLMNRMQERVVLITGGAAGLGRAAALRMAAEGARVALLDVDDGAGPDAAEEI